MKAALAVLEDVCLRAMAALAPFADAAPRHGWLVDRWRIAVAGREVGRYVEPGEEFERAYAELGFPPAMARFHREALARLPELLRDEVRVQELLFAGGDVLTALAAYQDNTITQRLNAAAGEVVRASGPRVLELGGGAGLCTAEVLKALSGRDYDYTFTDVSPLFTRAAADRFGDDPRVSFRLLDLDADFAVPGDVDVVLAGNVLHNAADIGRSLRRVRRVLAPGGRLVFTEATADHAATLTSMQFLLSGEENRVGTPFLDGPGWHAALTAAGFAVGEGLSVEGQTLFVATALGIPPDWPAAKVLAHLERSRVAEVELAAATVCALAAEPSFPLADLSALRRIRYHGGEVPDAVRDAFGVELVRDDVDLGDVADLLASVAEQADRELAGIDLDAAVAAVDAFGRTALLSMLNALVRLGDRPVAFPALVGRWRVALRRAGLADGVDPEEHSDAALDRAWTDAATAWERTAGSAGTVEYARRNAERLPDLLDGTCDAVTLLFPEGRTDLADALYRENVTGRYQHAAVGALLGGIAARWPAGRTLRVLEVGAGTGATTDRVLPALAATGVEVDYLYTDVSRYFLDRAADRLRAYSWVRFDRVDIDADPVYATGSFDVVIGGGVLNAAADTDASVRRLTGLLSPGGWLVLTEPTVEEPWILTSQAFLMAEPTDGRAATGATFLTLDQWNGVLDAAGLDRVLGLPRAGHPLHRLGHRVFVARPSND
ncbi:class I SAM-dependent methyltransferase [Umezawaea sp. NPDC059074]|uniref:class I SAM-dependent methyltransferase n=1 Tax=Umezawaea sp. NPDC059074 TaxID=3346716 RepID=UPI003687106A